MLPSFLSRPSYQSSASKTGTCTSSTWGFLRLRRTKTRRSETRLSQTQGPLQIQTQPCLTQSCLRLSLTHRLCLTRLSMGVFVGPRHFSRVYITRPLDAIFCASTSFSIASFISPFALSAFASALSLFASAFPLSLYASSSFASAFCLSSYAFSSLGESCVLHQSRLRVRRRPCRLKTPSATSNCLEFFNCGLRVARNCYRAT
jgi:hypothetical protein